MSLHDTSASELSLVDSTALDDKECRAKDLVFTVKEFEQMDYQLIRRLAATAETDDVNGKSPMLAMRQYFCRQASLEDYD